VSTWSTTTARPDFHRLTDWFGVWAIETTAGRSLWEQIQRLELHVHVRDHAQTPGDAAAADKRRGPYAVVDGVAVLPLEGTLLKHRSSLGGTSLVETRRALRSALDDPRVDGLLVLIDSPGGTVAGTGDLADALYRARQRKPVSAFIEDLGASAAYWIASQAERVWSNPTGLVGSLGVFAVVEDTSGLYEQLKIQVHVLRSGEFKGAGTDGAPVTAAHLAEFQRQVDGLAEAFLAAVARGRGRERSALAPLADGRVHLGPEALALGLIDQVGTLDAALDELRQRAKSRARNLTTVTTKGGSMSDTPSANQSTSSTAATLAELRAACEGAPSDFLLAQLEAQATLPQAMQAWNAQLRADLAAARAQVQAAAQRAEQAEHRTRAAQPAGVTPITGQTAAVESEPTGSAIDRFDALVRERLAAAPRLERFAAIRAVAKEQPELYQAFLLETNPSRKAQRMIQEKLN
jgi:signal peptide peptidase SppA